MVSNQGGPACEDAEKRNPLRHANHIRQCLGPPDITWGRLPLQESNDSWTEMQRRDGESPKAAAPR
jgi:hypothetical protein